MLRTLLESNACPPRRRAGLVASIAVHTLLIAGALAATASARLNGPGDRDPPRVAVVYTQPRSSLQTRPPGRIERGARYPIGGRRPVSPTVALTLPFNADSLLRHYGDIDVADAISTDTAWISCRRRCDRPGGTAGNDSPSAALATLATVDRTARLLSPARPRYPDVLRSAGVTGRVTVQLVVDTLGRIEPGSIRIIESSHDLFSQAVRAVLPALRFASAEAGGRRVRMLVNLPFEFRLNEAGR